jgi:hypothetical protein
MTPREDDGWPFPLNAKMMLTNCDLSCAQQKALAILELQCQQKCAEAKIEYFKEVIKIIDNLENKG